MTTEGGGWTMFGRGKGGGSNQRCWRTAGACYKQDLGNTNMAWNNANTAKFSDAWVNAMTYTRIRFSGSNYIKVNWYVRMHTLARGRADTPVAVLRHANTCRLESVCSSATIRCHGCHGCICGS